MHPQVQPSNVVPFNGAIAATAVLPEVEILNGKPVTTSLQVAEFFGKQHKNVLQDIRNILDSEIDITGLNFQLSEYQDSTGRSLPMYIMDKDAFTLLVMGYTGEDALRFKLAYIRRFNEMESHIRNNQLAIPNFNDPIAAAEAWIVAERSRIAEHERAEYLKKRQGEINNTKTATAMNTASQFSKENAKLKDSIGIGKHYRQVKAIEWLGEEFNLASKSEYSQIGKALSKFSRDRGQEPLTAPDSQFGTVKMFHVDVIAAFRLELHRDRNLLGKIRRR